MLGKRPSTINKNRCMLALRVSSHTFRDARLFRIGLGLQMITVVRYSQMVHGDPRQRYSLSEPGP